MQDKRQAAKERRTVLLSAEEVIDKLGAERTLGRDLAAVLTRQIAYLAVLRRRRVAHVQLAAVLGVEVAHGGGAVSVAGDGERVDVPVEGAVGGLVGEVSDVDGELDAGWGADGLDGALDCVADEGVEHGVWEGGEVGGGGLVGLRGCWAVDGCVACVWGEWGDDGALECVDAGERGASCSWDDGEDTGLGG